MHYTRCRYWSMMALLVLSAAGCNGATAPDLKDDDAPKPRTADGDGDVEADEPKAPAAKGSEDPAVADAGAPPRAGTIDLKNWKLTLPVAGTSSKPKEITQPALDTFSLAPYFTRGGEAELTFQANAGGFTTSNSVYPRSELREMANGGTSEASWSTGSGRHTMEIEEAITHLPEVKPEAVAGQIHDAEDDVVMIRLEGKHLFVEGGGTDLGNLDSSYTLGTRFTVKMLAENDHIKVSYNGQEKVDVARKTSGCYFKAGVYTQSNTSKGDAASAYGEVRMFSLRVTHE